LSAGLAVAGCTVGPDFLSPAAPEVDGYTPEPLVEPTASADVAGGAAQRFVAGQDIPGQWWTLFHSPPLNRLVERALAANPDLQAAQAALRQAQENVRVTEGGLYPSIDAGLSNTRQQAPPALLGVRNTKPSVYSLANASVSVSYALDVFGGIRRSIEAAEAQADVQRFQLEATYLSLTANLVTAAIDEASLRAQIAATNDIIAAEMQQLDVVRRQFNLGGASRADVLAQESTLAQTRATLPALDKQLAQLRNQLTALAGEFPSHEVEETFTLAGLTLPEDLPVSVPSRLVGQRPDVRAATATLHQASAEIGVARANQLPSVTLSADWGSAASQLANLFTPGTGLWSLGGAISQPIVHGGALEHKRLAAEAAYDQAAALYRSTVLGAFQNVADALRALQSDALALQAQLAAERVAADSLALSREQYTAGAISYLTLLNAERTFQQTHISLAQAQAARYADTAALFQALGGGWWNRSDETAEMK
jgi:NodT family efflux transporter outer membrane factor (OMF) lipoprotein